MRESRGDKVIGAGATWTLMDKDKIGGTDATITNNGTIRMAAGSVFQSKGGQINNTKGGVFNAEATSKLTLAPGADGKIVNAGKMNVAVDAIGWVTVTVPLENGGKGTIIVGSKLNCNELKQDSDDAEILLNGTNPSFGFKSSPSGVGLLMETMVLFESHRQPIRISKRSLTGKTVATFETPWSRSCWGRKQRSDTTEAWLWVVNQFSITRIS